LHTRVSDTSQRSKRILLVRTDRLGDVVLTLPMLPLLRKRFPDAFLGILLNRYAAELVSGNPQANEILLYDDARGLIAFNSMLQTIR
jgi:heptosyltransferase-2